MDPKSQPIKIRRTLGSRPPRWDRRVIFVSNLLGLFFGNDQETGVLRQHVGRLESYGGRLIPLLGLLFRGPSPNMVVLEQEPDPDLVAYFREQLQLNLPEVAVLAHADYETLKGGDSRFSPAVDRFLKRLESHEAEWLDGFVTDASLVELGRLLGRRTISSPEASRCGNNKLLLHQHLESIGLPTFETRIATVPEEVPRCLAELRALGYKSAVIKAQIGASGIGLARVATDSKDPVPAFLFYEGDCLVQGWLDDSHAGIDTIRSPSVQLFLDEDSLHFFDVTDQILGEDSVHEGNLASPPWLAENPAIQEELLSQAEATGGWLHQQGYRGTASVDFHVAWRDGRPEVRVCEINARVTGATYPSMLARHFLPKGRWLMRNLKFEEPLSGSKLLETLEQSGLLFHPEMARAILPINFNTQRDRCVAKGQFLCLGESVEELMDLLEQARHLLPVKGEFDRD